MTKSSIALVIIPGALSKGVSSTKAKGKASNAGHEERTELARMAADRIRDARREGE